jgi:hypothetical protein
MLQSPVRGRLNLGSLDRLWLSVGIHQSCLRCLSCQEFVHLARVDHVVKMQSQELKLMASREWCLMVRFLVLGSLLVAGGGSGAGGLVNLVGNGVLGGGSTSA